MTLLIVPVTAGTFEQAKADLLRAKAAGADMVELRLDCMAGFAEADLAALRQAAGEDVRLLMTPRGREEGGASWGIHDPERLTRLCAAAPYAEVVDAELAAWEAGAESRDLVARAVSRMPRGTPGRARLILSAHDFTQRPAALCRIVARMNEIAECDVAKVVFHARHISECFELFDLMRGNPKPVIAIAMGEAGLITRILARKFGA
ncbi:MAG TPA: type I 3-dehydroquinate dehydratase, partial [Phycisphaerae bacterium]|nr:type I 3-dehydroquinate dehydratase [Phycisphaerae bacterium]